MARPLPMASEISPAGTSPRLALSRKGFRPFFLLAALFAIMIVPAWLLVLRGGLRPSTALDPLAWHVHEMIYGYTVAVIAGFLLTAVGNWTKRETLIGAPLLGLALLWLLGRIVLFAPGWLPHHVAAAVDLAFLPLLAAALARPLFAAANRRNYGLLAIVLALFATNLIIHLDALGALPAGSGHRAAIVALDCVLLVILVIAGRVFPMFTRNTTGIQSIRSSPGLDVACLTGMSALAVSDAVCPTTVAVPVAATLTGALAILRARRWGAQYSLREPLLWILHAGYAWLTIGLLLRAFAAGGMLVARTLAMHALTVGAIGSLTLGMMARVSLGHTGRLLVAPPAARWAFLAINAAAAARVFLPLALPGSHSTAVWVSALSWSGAFSMFAIAYAPMLCKARVDGRPG